MAQIAIIAANALTRSGTETLLSKSGVPPNCIVTFETITAFLDYSESKRFDVALLDDEPYLNHIEAVIKQLLGANREQRIIVLSERLMVTYIRNIIKQGVSGFIYKEGDMEESLSVALSAVKRGTIYMSPEVSEMLLNNKMISLSGLNKRDIAVLHLMAAELNIQEIAYHLHTSNRTIYRSREKLREALHVQTNEMIVDAARQQGLLNDV